MRQSRGQKVCSRMNSVSTATKGAAPSRAQASARSSVRVTRCIGCGYSLRHGLRPSAPIDVNRLTPYFDCRAPYGSVAPTVASRGSGCVTRLLAEAAMGRCAHGSWLSRSLKHALVAMTLPDRLLARCPAARGRRPTCARARTPTRRVPRAPRAPRPQGANAFLREGSQQS